MGEECYIKYLLFSADWLWSNSQARRGLVSVQLSEILGQKATEKKSLSGRKKINDLPCHQFQKFRLCASGHGDKSRVNQRLRQ